jgi:tripartite-type tricarboxylate transporter receptor subunit TctC
MRTLVFREKLFGFLLVIISLNFLLLSVAWGVDYPTKPITLVVSASAGGPSDVHARILADVVSKDLGVPIVIVNKPGPGGSLAASFVANEKPDGYTFLVTQSGTMTSSFALFPNLPYKRTDYLPLFMSITVPCNVAVKADSRWNSLGDFFDEAKKNPGKLRTGSASSNISLIWRGLLDEKKLDITHMMYKGAANSLQAVLGGHVDANCDALTPMVSHIEAGNLRLLAAIGSKRNKNHPDVPTLKELGFERFSKDLWNGFYSPAGLPEPIMEKFVQAFEKALAHPDVQAKLEKIGVFANFIRPKDFAALVDEEYDFYTSMAAKQKK